MFAQCFAIFLNIVKNWKTSIKNLHCYKLENIASLKKQASPTPSWRPQCAIQFQNFNFCETVYCPFRWSLYQSLAVCLDHHVPGLGRTFVHTDCCQQHFPGWSSHDQRTCSKRVSYDEEIIVRIPRQHLRDLGKRLLEGSTIDLSKMTFGIAVCAKRFAPAPNPAWETPCKLAKMGIRFWNLSL